MYENKIVCCDILKLDIQDGIIDLIIVDTTYNKKKGLINDNLPKEQFLNLFEKWIKFCVSKLNDNGTFYCFINEDYLYDVKPIVEKYLIFRRQINWGFEPSFRETKRDNYDNRTEYVLYFTKSNNYTFNQFREKPSLSTINRWEKSVDDDGNIPYSKLSPSLKKRYKKENYIKNPYNIYRGSSCSNFIFVPRPRNKERKFGKHPTQKPEYLLEVLIQTSSNENDLVADFFMGSGSTCVVAKKLRRKYLGSEISREYYDIAKKRIKAVKVFRNITDFNEKEKTILDY